MRRIISACCLTFIIYIIEPTLSSELSMCTASDSDSAFDERFSSYESKYFNGSLPSIVDTFQNWGGYSGSDDLRDFVLSLVNQTDGESSFSVDDPEFQDYATGLVYYAAPGIVMFVITFLFGIIMMCARWCCPRKCCKPKKELDEYSCFQRYWPLTCLNIVALLSASIAIVSIMYLSKVKSGAENMICAMDDMSIEMSSSFESFHNHMEIYDSSLDLLLDEANAMSLGSVVISQVQDTASQLGDDMDILAAVYEQANPSSISRDYVSVSCAVSSLGGQTLEMTNSTRFDVLVPLISQVDALDQVTKPMIQGGIDAAQIAIDLSSQIVNYTTGELPDLIVEIDRASADKTEHWQTGSFAFFSFVFFAVLVSIGSFIAYLTPCKFDDKIAHAFLHCSWFFSWGFAAVLFLFCGLGIPIAIIFSDTCVLLQEIPTEIDLYFSNTLDCNGNSSTSEASCTVLESCFQESAPSYLTQVLDLFSDDQNVNFEDQMQNYSYFLNNSEASLNSLFSDHVTWVLNTETELSEFTSCHVDTTDGDDALDALNQALGGSTSYSRTQCLISGTEGTGTQYETEMNGLGNCAPTANHSSVTGLHDLRARVIQTLRLEDWWSTTDMTNRYNNAISISNTMNTDYVPDVNSLNSFANQALQIGQESVVNWNTLLSGTQDETCSFVGMYYDVITESLCSESLEGFAGATLAMFVVALLGWPQIVFSVYVSIRDFGSGQAGKESGSNKVAPKVIY